MTMPFMPCHTPPLLPAKGTVGIVAPSRWPRKEMLEGTIAALEARGYETVVHDQCYQQNGTLAGSDAARAEALNEMFADRTIDAILCARGGSGAMLVLDRLDYETIRANPKPLIGSSDVTALLHAVMIKAGLVTYHGPMCFHFLPERHEVYTEQDLFYMIAGETGSRLLRFPMARVERAGQAQGRLVGGNLSMLAALIGTPYDWSGDGAILFLEEVNEPLYRIERMMAQLRLAGKFEGVRAVLVGEMVGIPEEKPEDMPVGDCPYGRTLDDIMRKHLPTDIPLAFDVPCGHGRYLTTFPIGATARVMFDQPACEIEIRL